MKDVSDNGNQIVYKLWNNKTNHFCTTGSRGKHDNSGSIYLKKPPKSYATYSVEDYDNWDILEFELVLINRHK